MALLQAGISQSAESTTSREKRFGLNFSNPIPLKEDVTGITFFKHPLSTFVTIDGQSYIRNSSTSFCVVQSYSQYCCSLAGVDFELSIDLAREQNCTEGLNLITDVYGDGSGNYNITINYAAAGSYIQLYNSAAPSFESFPIDFPYGVKCTVLVKRVSGIISIYWNGSIVGQLEYNGAFAKAAFPYDRVVAYVGSDAYVNASNLLIAGMTYYEGTTFIPVPPAIDSNIELLLHSSSYSDSSAHNRQSTLSGTPAIETGIGRFSDCFSFGTDNYVTYNDLPFYVSPANYCVDFWYKVTDSDLTIAGLIDCYMFGLTLIVESNETEIAAIESAIQEILALPFDKLPPNQVFIAMQKLAVLKEKQSVLELTPKRCHFELNTSAGISVTDSFIPNDIWNHVYVHFKSIEIDGLTYMQHYVYLNGDKIAEDITDAEGQNQSTFVLGKDKDNNYCNGVLLCELRTTMNPPNFETSFTPPSLPYKP